VLHRPESFEPLTDEAWDEARVRDAIAAIVADADSAYDAESLWPVDEWDLWDLEPPLKELYSGSAGVVWALDVLRRRGYAESKLDLPALALQSLELWRSQPDLVTTMELPKPPESSLLIGESGILLLAWKLAPSAELADTLFERVQANVGNEAYELMWGSPGTMLAAHAMHEWTGEERWAQVWDESAEVLRSRRNEDGSWTTSLHGSQFRDIGPIHGMLGNVHALLQRGRVERLEQDTAIVLRDTAVIEDGLANWVAYVGGDLVPRDGEIRLQWCHGSPGIVATAAPYLDEGLMLSGAELTWRAGAHGPDKGAGLCHGTAGNGFALLKTFERTGDEQWLDRARRFAVHALRQAEKLPGRYSLFTGRVGVGLFAAACLDADARFPVMDGWD
jgi:lantibiotic modifying enzyme